MANFIGTSNFPSFLYEGNFIEFEGLKINIEDVSKLHWRDCEVLSALFSKAAKVRKEEFQENEKLIEQRKKLADVINA